MIWAVLAIVVAVGWFLFQWGAGKVAGEKLKEADRDVEAAARMGQILADGPRDKPAVLDRLRDKSREL